MTEQMELDSPEQVDQYVDEASGVVNSCMTAEDRAAELVAAVNARLAQEGLPAVGWRWGASTGSGAAFDFRGWEVEIDRGQFEPASAEAAGTQDQAWMMETVYHEARHSEEWFTIARRRAGMGDTPADIASQTGIPERVALAAWSNPIMECNETEAAAAEWDESVYGAGAQHRNEVLGDVDNRYQEYRQLPEEVEAWDTAAQVEQEYVTRNR